MTDQIATGFAAGLTGDEQIRIALRCMIALGGEAQMQQLYEAIEKRMSPTKLSDQGRASLRFFINRVAVEAGYVEPHDKSRPGWRPTAAGQQYATEGEVVEEVVDAASNTTKTEASNSARGAAFERYTLRLLRAMYPSYSWFHQGERKSLERGLDFIGTPLGEKNVASATIGVQVKFHQPGSAPTQLEWLKFLAGCFSRRLSKSIFISTGRLTSAQQREAAEAEVVVIEGRDEVTRVASVWGIEKFDLFDDTDQ